MSYYSRVIRFGRVLRRISNIMGSGQRDTGRTQCPSLTTNARAFCVIVPAIAALGSTIPCPSSPEEDT